MDCLQEGQAPQQPNTWNVIKTLVIRMLVIYFIASFFRRSPSTPNNTEGAESSIGPATNLFEKGLVMVCYM